MIRLFCGFDQREGPRFFGSRDAGMPLIARRDVLPQILDGLERLAGITGQWVDLLNELREVIPQLPATARGDVWVRIARVYSDKLNHLDYALASLGEAQKLTIPDAEKPAFLSLRADLCRRAQRWKDLADTLGQIAELTEAKDKRVDLYLEQGEIFETRLSDNAAAIAASSNCV